MKLDGKWARKGEIGGNLEENRGNLGGDFGKICGKIGENGGKL